jgi:hypothetical protein
MPKTAPKAASGEAAYCAFWIVESASNLSLSSSAAFSIKI